MDNVWLQVDLAGGIRTCAARPGRKVLAVPPVAASRVALLDLIAAKKIEPVIDRAVPLEGAIEGLAQIRDRSVLGKIIVTP